MVDLEPITTLSTLRAATFSLYENDEIQPRWPVILQTAEERIKNDIVSKDIEASIYGDLTAPVLPEPTDVSQYQRLVIYRSNGSEEYTLDYVTPGAREHLTYANGIPRSFTIIDQTFVIYPTPDKGYRYVLYYVPEAVSLTDATPTNDLLKRIPSVYLYACLAGAAMAMRNTEQMSEYLALYGSAWRDYQSATDRTRNPLSSGLVMIPEEVV